MPALRVAVATPDLMDRSRITSSLAGLDDVEVTFVGSPDALVGLAGVDVVIVDLAKRGALDALADIVASAPRVIAYGSHVDRATLESARAAGVDDVLTRSAFFAGLPRFLRA